MKMYSTIANSTGIRIVPISCAFAFAASFLNANPVEIPMISVKIRPMAVLSKWHLQQVHKSAEFVGKDCLHSEKLHFHDNVLSDFELFCDHRRHYLKYAEK